jgi:hypothetical protein
MSRTLHPTATAALLIACLQRPGHAEPAAPDHAHHDPVAAPTPWLDLGTSPIIEASPPAPPRDHKLAAALTLGGIYAGFTTWTYFAWYRHHHPLSQFRFGGDVTPGRR